MVAGLTCPPILDELAEILTTKLRFSPQQSSETLVDLLSFLDLIEISGTLKAVPADPDDDKVIECALVGGASHIVTGDRRHLLKLGSYGRIAIVDAARLLSLVETDDET
jgi:predicted nucleic acid-binding protein